jgi:Tfp pilus assembly protein PilF
MSHWELENWPHDQWNANPDVSPLAHSDFLFKRALVINPYERTALHRSGLIAMRSRDFSTAQTDLERAFYIDTDHRGIRKSLGYAYVWESDLENAERMLQEISEARDEMEVYSWWWGENNRRDLATQASEMVSILDTVNQ